MLLNFDALRIAMCVIDQGVIWVTVSAFNEDGASCWQDGPGT